MRAPKYVKQLITSIKELMDNNTKIVGDFNITLTSMARSSKQKINKETVTLNDTLNQTNLTDIFRTFHLKTVEYTLFSSTHGTVSRTDDILGHETSLKDSERSKPHHTSFLTTTSRN